MLHKGYKQNLISEGVQSMPLCSNIGKFGCTPLAINPIFISEDEALDYLAEVLVDSYLEKIYETRKAVKIKQSGDLLSSINKGTGG